MGEVRDIEDLLVWAFRDQRVERYAATLRGAALGPSGSMESGIGQILALGTKVDTTAAGAKWLGARCHDDAVTLYDAVMALPDNARVELVKHARAADEPYWYPEGPGQWVTPRDKWGAPKLLYRDPVRKRDPIGEAPPELIGVHPAWSKRQGQSIGSGTPHCASWPTWFRAKWSSFARPGPAARQSRGSMGLWNKSRRVDLERKFDIAS